MSIYGKFGIVISVFGVSFFVAYTQLTFFVIPPIGAVSSGTTLLILRLNKSEFIDSPDAMCARINGSVNLICRATIMGAVVKNSQILARLPYSQTLHEISEAKVTYE